ncbi:MAG TPA: fused MFS/spermidine synthase [Gemmatimonadaceae bacterium]|nr:fused MFS/spermidine synthase [Gemmatimonadaceae bacterium]
MIVLALLFILSGAAGLIYESVWARYISLLVGHSAYAQVIVLVIFLGGMAVGSLVVGKWSERIRSPLLWYALVEAIIAIIAVVFHDIFVGITGIAYEHWLPRLSAGPAVTSATWILAALLILPQSILLGATFPLMTAGAIRRNPEGTGASIGLLYFANSFGAAIGALVGGFTLVSQYGLDGTLRAAAALNFAVAVGIIAGFVRPGRDGLGAAAGSYAAPSPGWRTLTPLERVLLGVSFLTAFSSFLYEIAWTRMLSMVNGSATHSFELMLSAFILGLAVGSLWISRRADGTSDRMRLLGRLQWAMGLAAIATLPLYLWSFDWTASLLGAVRDTDSGYRLYSVARYAIALSIMLPATFFAGTTLPLITKILLASGSGERVIGAVYGVNTIGSIVGAAVAALLLVPLIGLKWVLIGGGLIDIGVGIVLLLRNRQPARESARSRAFGHRGWTLAIGLSLGLIVGIALTTPFAPARLASGVYRYKVVPGNDVFRYLFYRDGRTATVSVRQVADDSLSLFTISTNGKPDASMSPAWARPWVPGTPKMALDQDMSTQLMLPLLVLAHAPSARLGAVIGQGSGITSHILLTSPTIEKLHTIEIEPEMINGSRILYPGNKRVFDDPRSSFEIDDARAFLSASGPGFDFVVSEPSNPWVSGVSGLFTVEFYRRVKSRLRPGGIFTQWFHMYEIDDASVASVLAGIDRVFGDYRMYVSSNSDLIIVASADGALPPADWAVTRFPEMAKDLEHFAPLTPEILDATIVGSRATLGPYLKHARLNSDFDPFLDLNGERLRFRNMFADGFREIAEARFDVLAALEDRRRPLATTIENPATEIVRASALARGARLRIAREYGATEITTDSLLRQSAARIEDFDGDLERGTVPSDWNEWLTQFAAVEEDLHGGTAGAADEAFYGKVRAFLRATKAPAGVLAAVDLHHGLAAWDFTEAARAGDTLVAHLVGGARWLPTELVRRGTALAKLELGDVNGAARAYTSLATIRGTWTLLDSVLQAYIERLLETAPPADTVSRGGASSAPAPPRR